VPICFAVVDRFIVSAVDHKPKRTGQLRRLRDMAESGTATVLVDHYDEDWSALWWVRIRGQATVHLCGESGALSAVDALVAKYAQYRDMPPTGEVFRVALDEVRWWSPAARGGSS
jgi:PPOX class probable F420-dependent enzyme